jgi:hypothetical protein
MVSVNFLLPPMWLASAGMMTRKNSPAAAAQPPRNKWDINKMKTLNFPSFLLGTDYLCDLTSGSQISAGYRTDLPQCVKLS